MHNRFQQVGFTLIELLVSTTIMILMFGAGVASYVHFNNNQTAITTGQQLQLMLRTAQKKARVGDKPAGCSILQGYQLAGAAIPNSVISINAICSSGTIFVDSYTLPNGVTLQQAISVTFKVLTGGTNQPGTVVVVGVTGTTYSFTVGAGGDISEGTTVTM